MAKGEVAHSPVLFLGHGSPMLALENGPWHAALRAWITDHPGTRNVLVISAHWETANEFTLTNAARHAIRHDYSGFAKELYSLDYPAPGDPKLAAKACHLLSQAGLNARLEPSRPLDHGAWVPLRTLFPEAKTPVVQLSLPRPRTPELLVDAGRALAPLREEGVLILCSGGMVHNLRRLAMNSHPDPEEWALRFDNWTTGRLLDGDLEALLEAPARAPRFRDAVPSSEHFDPLYLGVGAADHSRCLPVYTGWQHGNLSLRAVSWG
ncbi:MAG: class III extradiol ring-cleavage dioxygenase [Holophaga sp.]|nr:class III extradiol ring-cleavage dioxygenase [Holophaga sp.]